MLDLWRQKFREHYWSVLLRRSELAQILHFLLRISPLLLHWAWWGQTPTQMLTRKQTHIHTHKKSRLKKTNINTNKNPLAPEYPLLLHLAWWGHTQRFCILRRIKTWRYYIASKFCQKHSIERFHKLQYILDIYIQLRNDSYQRWSLNQLKSKNIFLKKDNE